MIKKSASIGANSTIICGNSVGRYAFIGAGTVITKDIPDFALVFGNPGKIIGWVDKKGNRLKLDQDGNSSCGNYSLDGTTLINKSDF